MGKGLWVEREGCARVLLLAGGNDCLLALRFTTTNTSEVWYQSREREEPEEMGRWEGGEQKVEGVGQERKMPAAAVVFFVCCVCQVLWASHESINGARGERVVHVPR